jgi:glycosyltransferase involved in cell wall biosynthesis
LLQGYPNLEYIIIDGGSTDNSVEIIKKYEPWLSYWVSEEDRGQSHAINKGFERATGELLGWLNSDDWYTEGALFKLVAAYQEDRSVGAVYGQGKVVNAENVITHIPKMLQINRSNLLEWANGGDFMQPSCLFTRSAWQDCGPLDEGLNYSLDVDLWLKISERYKFKQIPDLLSIALSHPGAKTASERNAMYADLAIVLMRHGGEAQARKLLDKLVDHLNQVQIIVAVMNKVPLVNVMARCIKKFIKA